MDFYRSYKELRYRVKASDLGKRMASGAIWTLLGTGIGKFMVLVSGTICAHLLTKEQYGQLGIVRSTINLFVIIGAAGLSVTATKYISEYLRKEKEHISSIYLLTNGFAFITGLIVTIAILLLAPFLAEKTLHSTALITPIQVGAVLLFVTVINAAQKGTLSGFEDFRSLAINGFWGSLSESVFILIGAYYGGVLGAILGYGSGYIVLYILNNRSIKNNLKKYNIEVTKHSFRRDDIKVLYRFSLPALLSSLMVSPTYWVIRTVLTRSAGFESLAIFEAASQWKLIILFIPASVSTIVLPILSSLSGESKDKYKRVLKVNIFFNVGLAIIIAVFVILASPIIMRTYGKAYTDNTMTLILLTLSTIPQTFAQVIGHSISSRAKVWQGLCFNLLWAFMTIAFTVLFLKVNNSPDALAAAILLAYTIHATLQFIYIRYTLLKH